MRSVCGSLPDVSSVSPRTRLPELFTTDKVSSAVRVQHVPSGMCVRSAGARSQKANLDQALLRLAALLRERAEARRAAGRSARREAHYRAERGRPIRTYVLDDDGSLVERSPLP